MSVLGFNDFYIIGKGADSESQYHIRIYQNFRGIASPPAQKGIILSSTSNVLNGIGELKKQRNDEDGYQLSDEITIKLRDTTHIVGYDTSNSFALVDTVLTNGNSLLSEIFSDETATYTIEVGKGAPANPEPGWLTDEIFFIGDIDPSSIPYDHLGLHNPGSSTEEAKLIADLTVHSAIQRLDDYKISDLNSKLTSSHMVGNRALSSYAGISIQDPDGKPSEVVDSGVHSINVNSVTETSWPITRVLGYERFESLNTGATFGTKGHWWVLLSTLLEVMFEDLAGITFDPNDMSSNLYFWPQKWDSTNSAWSTSDSIVSIKDIAVHYNTLFGRSPLDWKKASCPLTLDEDRPVSDLLKLICDQLGIYGSLEYAVDGQISIVFKAINATTISIPSSWTETPRSKEQQRQISKKGVAITNTGSEAKVICPADAKTDLLDIEIFRRTTQWGMVTDAFGKNWDSRICGLHDSKLDCFNQWQAFDAVLYQDTSDKVLRDNGWIGGAYLYFFSSDYSQYYPSWATESWGAKSSTGVGNEGMIALAYCGDFDEYYFGSPDHPNPKNYNTLVGPAKYYASHYIGNKIILEREFLGVKDDSGNISTIGPGMTYTTRIRGQVKTFVAVETEQNLITGVTNVKFVSPVDSTELQALTVRTDSKNGSTGSITLGTPTSNDAVQVYQPTVTTNAQYVARFPANANEAKIKSKVSTGTIDTVTVEANGSNNGRLLVLNDNSSTTGTWVDASATLYTNKTLYANNGILSTTIALSGKGTSAATTSGDPTNTLVTKGYADSTYAPPTNYIRTDPSTSAQNKILPTSTTAVPLTIQKKVSQASDLVEFYDSDGTTLIAWMDVNGKWYVPSTSGGDIGKTAASKDYVDALFASVSGFVVLNPSNDSINVTRPAAPNVTNIRLQGNSAGTANKLLQFENNTSSAITGAVDSFGRGYFGAVPTSREVQLYSAAKDDTHIGLYVKGGAGSSGSPASLAQINRKTGATAVDITANGEFCSTFGMRIGVGTTSVNKTLDDSAVHWRVSTASGNVTITLPVAADCKGRIYVVIRTTAGANSLTIARSTNPSTTITDTIKGAAANQTLAAQWSVLWFISDGVSNWDII